MNMKQPSKQKPAPATKAPESKNQPQKPQNPGAPGKNPSPGKK